MVLALAASAGCGAAQDDVELLFTGEFLGDRRWPASGETWLGLFATGPGYRLSPARIRVSRVPNACGGEATKVTADGTLQPSFLVKGLRRVPEGSVDTAFAGQVFLYPGQSLSVQLSGTGQWFFFRALGTAGQNVTGEVLFTDYRLEFRVSGAMDAPSQVILELPEMTLDNTPFLRWAGDLDRDRILDVLLEIPAGGYSTQYVLLLSSLAPTDLFLKQAATFGVLDC
jgi:hypothetical protein